MTIRAAIALAALAVPLAALPAAAQDVPPALSLTYVCDGGVVVQVAYFNPETGPSLAVVAWGGRLVPMRQGMSGSGVRYIAFDEQESYRWHTKGDSGFLTFLAADHTAVDEMVAEGCVAAGS